MALILDPGTDDMPGPDVAAFEGIQDLANITASPVEINNNPLFKSAENVVIMNVPSAQLGALPATDADGTRQATNRDQVVLALQFLTAAYFLFGGGKTPSEGATTTESMGPVESITETIGPITKTTRHSEEGTTTTTRSTLSRDVSVYQRARWFEEKANKILESLGAVESIANLSYIGKLSGRL